MLSWIIQNSLAACVLAALVAVICRFQTTRPALCHMLWVMVLVRLILPPLPLPSLTGPLMDDLAAPMAHNLKNAVSPPPSEPTAATPTLILNQVTATTHHRTPTHRSHAVDTIAPAPIAVNPAAPARRPVVADVPAAPSFLSRLKPLQVALGLWLSVALIILLQRLSDIVKLRRLLRLAAPAPEWLITESTRTAVAMDMEPPQVRTLHGIGSPFVWGLGRPALYWPEDWAKAGPAPASRPVLAHELAHLRRRDHLVAWLELVLKVALWWNPLVWLAGNRIRHYAEPACDAWAVQIYPDRRRAYADALINAIAPNPAIPAVAALSTGLEHKNFKRRLMMIMRKGSFQQVPKFWFFAGLCFTLAVSPSWSTKPAVLNTPAPAAAAPADPFDQAVDAAVLEYRARRLLHAKDYEAAADLYQQVAAKVPNNGRIQHQLGSALLHAGRYKQAAKAFEAQTRTDWRHGESWFDLARAYAGAGRDNDALDALEKAVDLNRWHNDHFAEPEFESLSDHPRFIKIMQQGLKVRRLFKQIELSEKRGESEEVAKLYNELLDLSPNSPQIHGQVGYNLIKSGNTEAAEKAFRRQLELDPTSSTAAYNVACCLSLQGEPAAALTMLQKAVSLGWNSWSHMERDDDLAAVRELAGYDALIAHRTTADDLEERYKVASRHDNDEAALELLDQLLAAEQEADDRADIYRHKAMILYKKQDWPAAAQSFKQAIALDLDNMETNLYNLACVYALAGEKDRALDMLEKAISVGYDDASHMQRDSDLTSLRGEVRFKALVEKTADAQMLAKFGAQNWDEAIERAQKRLDKSPRSQNALEQMGWAQLYKGDPQQAMKAFEALDEQGVSPVKRYNIACAFARTNHVDQAMTWLERAREAGWDDYKHMRRDDDMDNLREDVRYQTLIAELKAEASERHEHRYERRIHRVEREKRVERESRSERESRDKHDHDHDHDEDHR